MNELYALCFLISLLLWEGKGKERGGGRNGFVNRLCVCVGGEGGGEGERGRKEGEEGRGRGVAQSCSFCVVFAGLSQGAKGISASFDRQMLFLPFPGLCGVCRTCARRQGDPGKF